MGNGRGFRIGRLVGLIAFIVALTGWLEVFVPPVIYYKSAIPNKPFGIFDTLIHHPDRIYPDHPVFAVIFLATSPIMVLAIVLFISNIIRYTISYLEFAEVGISVVSTKLVLTIDGDQRQNSTLYREQLFHANRPGTSAYHYSFTTTSEHGEMVDNSFEIETTLGGKKITKEVIKDASKRKMDVIEIFDAPLKTSFLATYLPDGLVLFIYNNSTFFHRTVAQRRTSVSHLNEYNSNNPMFQVTAPLYPSSKVELEVSFPSDNCPARVQCFRIKQNDVQEIHPPASKIGNRRVFKVDVNNLYQEKLRIQWQ